MDEATTLVDAIARIHGYGRVMQAASALWKELDPRGALLVGPAAASAVTCGCLRPHDCDWCCGSGWLTPLVKKVKDGTWNVDRGIVVPPPAQDVFA